MHHETDYSGEAVFDSGFLHRKKGEIPPPPAFPEGRRRVFRVDVGCHRKQKRYNVFFADGVSLKQQVVNTGYFFGNIGRVILDTDSPPERGKPFQD
jgi:hypothetical protein